MSSQRDDPLAGPYFADAETRPLIANDSLSTGSYSADGKSADAIKTAESPPGQTVPGFELIDVLGRGGMGVVYRARQIGLNRIVALKMILRGEHASKTDTNRFRREAEAVAALKHVNIVQIFEIGESEGLPFFSLEYVDGGSLAAKVNDSPLAPMNAALVIQQVAEGIAVAHQSGIVHRDLKPANILLALDGTPKIADFGLAKWLDNKAPADSRDSTPDSTATGNVLGTPNYMAPEQARGDRDIGPAADIWALGAVLYRVLTGRPPFMDPSPIRIIQKMIEDEPVALRSLDPHLPRDLETICLKCLRKEPQNRYATASDLAADLRRFRAGEPIHARRVGALEKLLKWSKRRPAIAALVLVSILAVIGSIVAGGFWIYSGQLQSMYQGKKREQEVTEQLRSEAVQARKRAEEQELLVRKFQYASDMNLADLAWQENRILHLRDLLARHEPKQPNDLDIRGFEWHLLTQRLKNHQHLLANNSSTLQGHSRGVRSVAFHPDGLTLASGSDDGTVRIFDARSGEERLIVDKHLGPVSRIAYSPDGKLLAIASSDEQKVAEIRLWDIANKRVRFTLKGHSGMIMGLSFDRKGEVLATCSFDRTVRLWDCSNGTELRAIREFFGPVFGVAYHPNADRLTTCGWDYLSTWDARTGKLAATLKGTYGHLNGVAYSPDGSRLVTVGNPSVVEPTKGIVIIWDAQKGTELSNKRESAELPSVAFSPDGRSIGYSAQDGIVRVLDAKTGKERLSLQGHTDLAWTVAFDKDSTRLASGSEDRTVKIWNIVEDRDQLIRHTSTVQCVAVSPDSKLIATASAGVIKISGSSDARERKSLRTETGATVCCTFSPDSEWIAAGGGQNVKDDDPGALLIWNAVTGESRLSIEGHVGLIRCIAFHPNGNWLATGGKDRTIKIWDAHSGKVIKSLDGHTGPVASVAFSPDGRLLASSNVRNLITAKGDLRIDDNRCCVKIWDTENWDEIAACNGHNSGISAVLFSPDGTYLASGGEDGEIIVWNPVTGQRLRSLTRQSGSIDKLSFSRDGRRLAAAVNNSRSLSGVVLLFDPAIGQQTLRLAGLKGLVSGVAFSRDDRFILAGSGTLFEGEARIWRAQRDHQGSSSK